MHASYACELRTCTSGTWLYDDDGALVGDPLGAGTTHSSLYASLRTNLPREVMGFLDFPFAAVDGSDQRRYPGHQEVLRYLQDFARRFDLHGLVRLGTEVVNVRKDGASEGWRVSYSSGAGVDVEEDVFDAVVVCNGHFTEPRVADIVDIVGIWPDRLSQGRGCMVEAILGSTSTCSLALYYISFLFDESGMEMISGVGA